MHTPSPWILNEKECRAEIPGKNEHHFYASYGGTIANARLIAFAPLLSEKGIELLQCLIDHGFEEGEDTRVTDFAETLAKARGE